MVVSAKRGNSFSNDKNKKSKSDHTYHEPQPSTLPSQAQRFGNEVRIKSFHAMANGPDSKRSLELLRRLFSLVKPIMVKHNFKVGSLHEFYPKEKNLLGMNMNKGFKIFIRLRYPFDEKSYLPEDSLIETMLHELTHNLFGPHDEKFFNFLNKISDELNNFRFLGRLDGEGFLTEGRKLGKGNNNHSSSLSNVLNDRNVLLKATEDRLKLQKLGMGSTRSGGRTLNENGNVNQVLGRGLSGKNAGGKSEAERRAEAISKRLPIPKKSNISPSNPNSNPCGSSNFTRENAVKELIEVERLHGIRVFVLEDDEKEEEKERKEECELKESLERNEELVEMIKVEDDEDDCFNGDGDGIIGKNLDLDLDKDKDKDERRKNEEVQEKTKNGKGQEIVVIDLVTDSDEEEKEKGNLNENNKISESKMNSSKTNSTPSKDPIKSINKNLDSDINEENDSETDSDSDVIMIDQRSKNETLKKSSKTEPQDRTILLDSDDGSMTEEDDLPTSSTNKRKLIQKSKETNQNEISSKGNQDVGKSSTKSSSNSNTTTSKLNQFSNKGKLNSNLNFNSTNLKSISNSNSNSNSNTNSNTLSSSSSSDKNNSSNSRLLILKSNPNSNNTIKDLQKKRKETTAEKIFKLKEASDERDRKEAEMKSKLKLNSFSEIMSFGGDHPGGGDGLGSTTNNGTSSFSSSASSNPNFNFHSHSNFSSNSLNQTSNFDSNFPSETRSIRGKIKEWSGGLKWVCQACTLFNESENVQCSACETNRPGVTTGDLIIAGISGFNPNSSSSLTCDGFGNGYGNGNGNGSSSNSNSNSNGIGISNQSQNKGKGKGKGKERERERDIDLFGEDGWRCKCSHIMKEGDAKYWFCSVCGQEKPKT